MIGLSIGAALACIAIVYVGAAVQASIGIGLGMISSPVLALVAVGFIPVAIVLAVIPLTSTVAWTERRHIDRHGLVWTLVGRVPGVAVGAYVAASLSSTVLAVLVAGSVLLSVLASITSTHFEPRDSALLGAGLASGFMATTTGVGGPPIALVYQHSDPVTMRSTVSAFFTVGAFMSLIGLALAGQVGTRQFELTSILLPSVALGVITARLLNDRLDPEIVRPAVLAVCSVSAVALLIETFA